MVVSVKLCYLKGVFGRPPDNIDEKDEYFKGLKFCFKYCGIGYCGNAYIILVVPSPSARTRPDVHLPRTLASMNV